MYEFVTGPLAWLAFLVFFIGIIVRLVLYVRGLDWKLDRVTYSVNTSFGVKGAVRSILFWLTPFGTHSWRDNPWFTLLVFVLHLGLIFTPLFLLAHNIFLQERWGFSLWSMPDALADTLTIAVIASAVLLAMRRIALPEVRIITSAYDYLMLAIAVAPFVTGSEELRAGKAPAELGHHVRRRDVHVTPRPAGRACRRPGPLGAAGRAATPAAPPRPSPGRGPS